MISCVGKEVPPSQPFPENLSLKYQIPKKGLKVLDLNEGEKERSKEENKTVSSLYFNFVIGRIRERALGCKVDGEDRQGSDANP